MMDRRNLIGRYILEGLLINYIIRKECLYGWCRNHAQLTTGEEGTYGLNFELVLVHRC